MLIADGNNGISWINQTSYSSAFSEQKPEPNQTLLFVVIVDSLITFPINFIGSQGYCKIAASAQTDFDIQKNGTSIGIIRWVPESNTATFISSELVTVTAGDRIEVIAPVTQDLTLAGIGFTLKGIKQS